MSMMVYLSTMNFSDFIRDIPDFPKPGILFKDITPLLMNPTVFRASVERLAEHYGQMQIECIAAAEARGFLFAAPLALALRVPLVPLRKPGKLPYRTYSLKYDLEYGQAELHMHTDGITAGQRVLMVDDVLATGGTMAAGCKLVERGGGVVASCAFLMEIGILNGREKLTGYDIFSLMSY